MHKGLSILRVLTTAAGLGLFLVSLTAFLTSWSPAGSNCPNLKAVEGAWGQWGGCSGWFTIRKHVPVLSIPIPASQEQVLPV